MHRLLTGPLTVERVTVPIRDLPERLQGCRIVQLSDFHFDGLRLSPWLLQAAIEKTQALAPDLIALTGDFVTKDPAPIFTLAKYLKALNSRFGTFAVLGNHDNLSLRGRQTIIQALTAVGITVLWNETAYPFGPEFPLVGLADYWSGEFAPRKALSDLSPDLPRLVLSHNPDTAGSMSLQQWRVDLQLSGHTHGGQIVLPGLGPLVSIAQQPRFRRLRQALPFSRKDCDRVVQHWEWASGLHRVGESWLYVNQGLGTYLPGRLFCPPELTEITLTRQGASQG
ncbi:metallophosphoesterase [Pseudanabaena sp. FACHB-2040]|uniref:metallophosphoesterase n=1 Tax=Pseudanabaena sp. FACHB-2040 TaxID=2692859 RepID=UPI001689B63E|nr:metallophosphoesterase [Pseudanabaena sp. FACHB-2040]MBD2259938.1 metallophosphoesterase [Pseudanabaena sp. FACHB-2040]